VRPLQETIGIGLKSATIGVTDLKRVALNATAQDKAIYFPHLCHRVREEAG